MFLTPTVLTDSCCKRNWFFPPRQVIIKRVLNHLVFPFLKYRLHFNILCITSNKKPIICEKWAFSSICSLISSISTPCSLVPHLLTCQLVLSTSWRCCIYFCCIATWRLKTMLEAGLLASNKFHFCIKLALTFGHTLSGWVQSHVGMPDCTHLCLLHVTLKGRQARWV